jgi:PAS domain S-box-containing protein
MAGREIFLTEDSFLVSETDEKGIIRYASDDFCQIAGYSREELLGKPHNIVRHPDMPKAAFKMVWDTIQSGQIWRGFVKNRTKDGNLYWVYATVYQTISCDGKKGYMSCRKMASRDEIAKAEALYATLD